MRQTVRQLSLVLLLVAVPALAQDGELDTTFGGDGIFSVSNGTGYEVAGTVASAGDGALFVGGASGPDESSLDFSVLRLNPAGGIDASWGESGRRTVAIDRVAGGEDELLRIVPDATGAAVLLGRAEEGSFGYTFPALARLTAGGDLDEEFGTLGIATPAAHPWTGTISTSAAAPHLGGFLFFGRCSACGTGGVKGFFLYRTLASGAPDGAFGSGGWLGIAVDAASAGAFATRPDGGIVFATNVIPMIGTSQLNVYARLANGAPDSAFAGTGLAVHFYDDPGWTPNAIALDPVNGAVVVSHWRAGGVEVAASALGRFSASGIWDAAFGFPELAYNQGSIVYEIVIDGAQRIFGAGQIDGPSTQPGGFFFARLLASGELDDSFDDNGVKRVEVDEVANGFDGAFALTLSGGRPVAAGFAQTEEGGIRFAVVRLTNALIFRDGLERGSTASWSPTQ